MQAGQEVTDGGSGPQKQRYVRERETIYVRQGNNCVTTMD